VKIGIRCGANYAYEEPASFSPHLVRLFPRNSHDIRIERAVFTTDRSADVQFRHDLFDNKVARCFFPRKLAHLDFHIELDLDLTERNPFHFLLESHALRLPFDYLPHEAAVLAPYLDNPFPVALPPELSRPDTPRPTIEALVNLNTWIFQNFDYERRDEGEARTPAETLAAGTGACRDFSVLLATVLRQQGVAARLVSGFLWEPPDLAATDRRAENALHAWTEAYLPGAGWVGLDPTNGTLADHHRIPAAVGLNPDDISPIKGCYYGHKQIESTMTATLEIVPR
jgi:transglutaminase-like putative cysteine protease